MSFLPQRKKSPAEIQQLREDLGIPATRSDQDPAGEPPAPAATRPAPTPSLPPVSPTTALPATAASPAPARKPPTPVVSLKRSERTLPVVLEASEIPAPAPAPPADSPEPVTLTLKPVRSLKKSEMLPAPAPLAPPPPDSKLPHQRHSDEELQFIRRQQALTQLNPAPNPQLASAGIPVIVIGYLSALAGAAPYLALLYQACFPEEAGTAAITAPPCIAFILLPGVIPACCLAIALLVAAFIALKKPISRHHAAFIAVITLFVTVFDLLHYFPQLRHGT